MKRRTLLICFALGLLLLGTAATVYYWRVINQPEQATTARQDAVSERVVVAPTPRLSDEERKLLTEQRTGNYEAHRLYLAGRDHWAKADEAGLKKGIESFQQAIALDPGFAQAYVKLASSYAALGFGSYVSPREAWAKGKAAVIKALELDGTIAEAHAVLADLKLFYDRDWPGAEREYQRAIELDSNDAAAHLGYHRYLLAGGRFDEAAAEWKRALELDQLSPRVVTDVAFAYFVGRRYDEAIAQCRVALKMDSSFGRAHTVLGEAYEQKGMHGEAIAEFQEAGKSPGGGKESLAALGHAYALSGDRPKAMKTLEELKRLALKEYVSPYDMARVYIGLGEKDQAFKWLAKADEERAGMMIYLKVHPQLDSLRSDPRFAGLLQSILLAR